MIYKTSGTCSTMIELEIDEDHIIRSVAFTGGCNGNLSGVTKLVQGRKAEEIADLLEGTTCGFKPTSCPDQLSHAIRAALAEME
jgi:uncharacterized protein (TIGR03905 family)